jgi:hypothetical protein
MLSSKLSGLMFLTILIEISKHVHETSSKVQHHHDHQLVQEERPPPTPLIATVSVKLVQTLARLAAV